MGADEANSPCGGAPTVPGTDHRAPSHRPVHTCARLAGWQALGVGLRVPLDRVATELDASQVECVHCSERARGRGLEVTPAAVPVAVPVRVCDAATPWQGCAPAASVPRRRRLAHRKRATPRDPVPPQVCVLLG